MAEAALSTRKVAVQGVARGAREPVFIAHPVIVDDQLYGAAALEVEARSEPALRDLVQRLGWGIGWLEALARRKTFTSKARLVTVLELIATSLNHERFQAAATAVATELATMLACERVSIGFLKGQHIHLRALSHSAAFGKKSNLARALEGAMDEAADQLSTVLYPAAQGRAVPGDARPRRARARPWRRARVHDPADHRREGARRAGAGAPGGRGIRRPHGRALRARGAPRRTGARRQAP